MDRRVIFCQSFENKCKFKVYQEKTRQNILPLGKQVLILMSHGVAPVTVTAPLTY
ncbi:hypothetical protein EDWATA_01845 [Edwardsiella tarda ATCC 23685]|uniref:Uncharacterized protein n=1 Tax=Edwardsiella tarda ATCC 23685 TaxID=500638 RepID=D4F517_EDWTA|nr:hypothetical protein EDWATA_01845 [Edwardsiella tarda ATCC 23685]